MDKKIVVATMTTPTTARNDATVPVSVEDFLEQDPPLRGQNYACLSFVSPEDALARKDVYAFGEFLSRHVSADLVELFAKLIERHPESTELLEAVKERHRYLFDPVRIQDEFACFERIHGAELDKAFFEKNAFRTSIRGIKIRGVFETLKEAEVRAQVLKRLDDRFHVYVAQVGCWCPWSPNPDDVDNQEYAETQLNTLMKNYRDNQATKDAFYEQRKRELQRPAAATPSSSAAAIVEVQDDDEDDPWTARKKAEVEADAAADQTPVDPKPA